MFYTQYSHASTTCCNLSKYFLCSTKLEQLSLVKN